MQPFPSVAINVTEYVPDERYVCVGAIDVDGGLPSPKRHVKLSGPVPVVVLENTATPGGLQKYVGVDANEIAAGVVIVI